MSTIQSAKKCPQCGMANCPCMKAGKKCKCKPKAKAKKKKAEMLLALKKASIFIKIAIDDSEFGHSSGDEFSHWASKLEAALFHDKQIASDELEIDDAQWADMCFDGECSDQVVQLLGEGDEMFGTDRSSDAFAEIVKKLTKDSSLDPESEIDDEGFDITSSLKKKSLKKISRKK